MGTAAPHPGQADLHRALRRGGAAAHAAGPQPVQLLTGGDRGHYLKRTKSSEIDLENGMIPITPYVGVVDNQQLNFIDQKVTRVI